MVDGKESEKVTRKRKDWEEGTLKNHLEKAPEWKKDFITTSSTPIKRLYTDEDIKNLDFNDQEVAKIIAILYSKDDLEGKVDSAKIKFYQALRDVLLNINVWFQPGVEEGKTKAKKIAEKVMKQYGKVDVLVNNAGLWYGVHGRPWDAWTVDEWDGMLAVNLRGTWLCCKAIAPLMIRQSSGKIINIASNVVKVRESQFFLPYALSKVGVYALTQSLAVALGPAGINVNAIAPGPTATESTLAMPNSDKMFEDVVAAQCLNDAKSQPT